MYNYNCFLHIVWLLPNKIQFTMKFCKNIKRDQNFPSFESLFRISCSTSESTSPPNHLPHRFPKAFHLENRHSIPFLFPMCFLLYRLNELILNKFSSLISRNFYMSGLVEASWNNNNEECRCSELSHFLDNESLHTEAIQNGRPKFLFFLRKL